MGHDQTWFLTRPHERRTRNRGSVTTPHCAHQNTRYVVIFRLIRSVTATTQAATATHVTSTHSTDRTPKPTSIIATVVARSEPSSSAPIHPKHPSGRYRSSECP